jgi:hypothetical protein
MGHHPVYVAQCLHWQGLELFTGVVIDTSQQLKADKDDGGSAQRQYLRTM